MPKKFRFWLIVALAMCLLAFAAIVVFRFNRSDQTNQTTKPRSSVTPKLKTEIVVKSLTNSWDIGFASDGTMFFTERTGRISALIAGKQRVLNQVEDVFVKGEGGLLGLAVDPEFASNRFIYTCFNTKNDIRLARWRVNNDFTALEERTDIISGMPAYPSGRHSGCRPRFGTDNYLWVGTGDAATGANPQSPTSLGGKILRVDRNGQPAAGNLEPPFDPRIYSYGHRNTQGIAFFTKPIKGVFGYSIEHGPDKNDELNPLEKGNFGWDPTPGTYNEKVLMTDLAKYPDAVPASWQSGDTTIAPSGATFIYGDKWQAWDGALAMAVLKGKHVRFLVFDQTDPLKLTEEIEVLKDFGRIRSVVQGPDGNLYFTTDNSRGTDQIVKATPL